MDSKRIFSHFFLICSTICNYGFCCPEFGPDDYKSGMKPPKTIISTSPEHIKFFEKNYTVVIDGIGIEVRFDCWAPYPIDVKFKGHLTNRGATVSLIERRVQDAEDESTFCFAINVTLIAFEEITGEYSCFSVENQMLRSAHYIYHAAHPPETLLNRNMALRLVLDMHESFTTLPCPTSNPHVAVHLSKDVKGEWRRIQLDGTAIRYNPQAGFVVLTSLIESDQPTRYRCATDLSALDFVDIIVSRPKMKVIPTPAQKILTVNEGEPLRVECKASEEFVFENSNPDVKGQTFIGLIRQNQGYTYVHSYETDILKAGDGGVISCISTATRDTLYDWSYRTIKKEAKRHGHSDKPTLNSFECKLPNGDMRIALYDCANWVECNLRKCNFLDRKCDSIKCDDARTGNCVKNGIIQCFNSNNQSAQAEIFFSGIQNKKIYKDWTKASPNSILKISRNGNLDHNSSISDSIEVELICEGSAFVFAVGFKWFLIQAKNVHLPIQIPDVLNDDPFHRKFVDISQIIENIQHKWKHLDSKNVIRSIAKMNITNKISQIICKAPIWNTTEWKQDVINLTLSHEHDDMEMIEVNSALKFSATISKTLSLLLIIFVINCLKS